MPNNQYSYQDESSDFIDPWAETRPQVIPPKPQSPSPMRRPRRGENKPPRWMRPRRRRLSCGCFPLTLMLSALGLIALFLLAPLRTNVLLLGIDYTTPGNAVGRSDTMILTTVVPLKPYIGMLSIPRDLWVNVPDYGPNRINTAHFFAEAERVGSGPTSAVRTVRDNFGVDVDYYIRLRFDGFKDVFEAMGGVDIELSEPIAGYPPGRHHLTANKALAFARDRSGADDFFRMEHGQLLIKATLKQMLNPLKWPRLPAVTFAMLNAMDTNLPVWHWPRIGLALLRAGPNGIDSQTINRDMVIPLTTDLGANVLQPNWERINPVMLEMFGQ